MVACPAFRVHGNGWQMGWVETDGLLTGSLRGKRERWCLVLHTQGRKFLPGGEAVQGSGRKRGTREHKGLVRGERPDVAHRTETLQCTLALELAANKSLVEIL